MSPIIESTVPYEDYLERGYKYWYNFSLRNNVMENQHIEPTVEEKFAYLEVLKRLVEDTK